MYSNFGSPTLDGCLFKQNKSHTSAAGLGGVQLQSDSEQLHLQLQLALLHLVHR